MIVESTESHSQLVYKVSFLLRDGQMATPKCAASMVISASDLRVFLLTKCTQPPDVQETSLLSLITEIHFFPQLLHTILQLHRSDVTR